MAVSKNYLRESVYFLYGSQWDQCSTTLSKVESYAETALTSARTTLLLVCVYVMSEGEGNQVKHYHHVFPLLKSIKILTEPVKWGGGGRAKIADYIIYGQPPISVKIRQ